MIEINEVEIVATIVPSETKFNMSNNFIGGHTERFVSTDAASIVACLYAMNYLLNIEYGKKNSDESSLELICDHYHQLREYAAYHLEAEAIFALID